MRKTYDPATEVAGNEQPETRLRGLGVQSAQADFGPFVARGFIRWALLLTLAPVACAQRPAAVYTSTREVTGLAVAPDGTLWAATTGGVLRRAPDGTWRKWTRADGLPSHEARRIAVGSGTVTVHFPTATAAWDGVSWRISPAPPPAAPEPVCAEWRGETWTATPAGLTRGTGEGARTVALPPSTGTHISALLPRPDALWAALYGDGLWAFDGKGWTRPEIGLPDAAREVTALADAGKDLWLGTRREGVWRYDGARWTGFTMPDEPAAHNIQALASFGGSIYASTLEDGLLVRSAGGWAHLGAGEISSNAPRQMAVFRSVLYVRNGDGRVDAFDGKAWTRDVFTKQLPRKQVSALAVDGEHLYLAQWGGWSEWDGASWVHHLRLPELQGVPITALLPDGGTMWAGTQGKGIAEVERASEKVRWHGAREGLSDDWVTALARSGGGICAGTFVGGLAVRGPDGWKAFRELAGQNVTALEPDGRDGLFVATRSGLWHLGKAGSLRRIEDPALDPEGQALLALDDALWLGTRTGLVRLETKDLRPEG